MRAIPVKNEKLSGEGCFYFRSFVRLFPVLFVVLLKNERISGLVFSCDFGGKRFVGKGWICLLLTLKPMANAATMRRFPVTKTEL